MSQTKFAMLRVAGWVRKYDGEKIPGLDVDFIQKHVTETEALNVLGANGYDVYDVKEGMDGNMPITIFRLKKKT